MEVQGAVKDGSKRQGVQNGGGKLTLHFHLEGAPFPTYPISFDLPPQSSQQSIFSDILSKAGEVLGLSDVEGIYTSVGLYPVFRVASFKDNASYAVRPTEDCAMSKSLLPRTKRESAMGLNYSFPAWPIVDEVGNHVVGPHDVQVRGWTESSKLND